MRIYHVTLTRQMDCTIAAQDDEELEAALRDARYDIDDWDPPQWEWEIYDPLHSIRAPKDLARLNPNPEKPDMAVDEDGEVRHIDDVPDVMDQVRETILEHQRKIVQDELQMKLPGVG